MAQNIPEIGPDPALETSEPRAPSYCDNVVDEECPQPDQPEPVVMLDAQVQTGDVSEFFADEFRDKFHIEWKETHDPRVLELMKYGEIRSYFPGYAFTVKLKFCDECVKRLLTHLNVVKEEDGIYLLRYYMCGNCLQENAIRLKK